MTQWLTIAKKVILGKKYRDRMKHGWNQALERLTKSDDGDSLPGHGIDEPDFSYRGRRPISQADVGSLLFGIEVSNLVRSGSLEQPMALLFMWGYHLMM